MELTIIISVLQTILVSMLLWFWQKKINRKEEINKKQTEARKMESLLNMEMGMANAKLTFAIAEAFRSGKLNGELNEGIEAYKAARDKYTDFINEQATEKLQS